MDRKLHATPLVGLVAFSGCKKETEPAPVADQRDQHIGLYACKVVVQDYTTK